MQWLYRFMSGRYGLDALGKFIAVVWIILAAVNVFAGSKIIYIIYLLMCIWFFFRLLSRNHPARQAENQKFLQFFGKAQTNMYDVKSTVKTKKDRAGDKEHKYVKCARCGANLRVARKKGKHTVKCPKCGNEFGVHIWF